MFCIQDRLDTAQFEYITMTEIPPSLLVAQFLKTTLHQLSMCCWKSARLRDGEGNNIA